MAVGAIFGFIQMHSEVDFEEYRRNFPFNIVIATFYGVFAMTYAVRVYDFQILKSHYENN